MTPAPDEQATALLQERAGASARGDMSTQAVQPYPDWCLSNGITNAYYGNRTRACGAWNATLDVYAIVNGVRTRVGRANYNLLSYVYTDASMGTWANQFSFSQVSAIGDGVGYSLLGAFNCVGGCATTGASIPATPLVNGEWHDYEAFVSTTAMTVGSVESSQGLWTWWFFKGSELSTSATLESPTVRCDWQVPGASLGCVMPDWAAGIIYYAAALPEFGAHIIAAQASGLPGGSPANPLYRTTDETLQNENRATACLRPGYPRPEGKSCDEYPFASTYQGAAGSGGGPRTYSWCGITLPGSSSTGPLGYSVCMIDKTENSRAGSLLQSVAYAGQRVIDGDPFYVQIS